MKCAALLGALLVVLARLAPAHADVLPPATGAWPDFQIIMWQDHTPAQNATLRALGVTAGMVETIHAARDAQDPDQMAHLLNANMPWYVENIATDFYSQYHRWSGGRPVNWRFAALKSRLLQDPGDRTAFVRDPGLSDPHWLARIRSRLMHAVTSQRRYRPLYYDLGDEPGIAETAAFWDFDLSQSSLTAMRAWLRQRYGRLAALDAEWGAHFTRWRDVVPTLTSAAMRRTDGNFAAWADFKEWMDVAFARALRAGTDAVHAADPRAIAAFEGGQIPGWGGYDYARLVGAVDAMELYDYGNNIDIAHSLNPRTILLTTSFGGGAAEESRVWRQLLRGARGLVLWDEKGEFVNPDATPGPRGLEAKGYYREIRDGLGALLVNSKPQRDPIAILYSPASFRIQWMLDQQPKGDAWIKRDAGGEYEDNAIRIAIRDYAAALAHLGFAPDYLTADGIERGSLRARGIRLLILPDVVALSAAASRRIRDFVAGGGIAIAVGTPGRFDAHGRRLAQPRLAALFRCARGADPTGAAFGKGRALCVPPGAPDIRGRLATTLRTAGVTPSLVIDGVGQAPVADVVPYRFRTGSVTIVGLLRDLAPPPPGAHAGPVEDAAERIVLTLPRPRFLYDLRQHKSLGRTDRVELALAPFSPTLLALSDRPVRPPLAP